MNQNAQQGPLVSTSALAKKLDLPARSVFELLVEKGWIERVNKHWKLTGKGQFEGGDYVNSKKYGEFIGWPEAVLEHTIFAELFDRPLRTRIIGRELDISAHRFNALLAELGWQQRHHRGWILTAAGREQGGLEREDEESGVPYTLWPRTILDDARLATNLDALQRPLRGLQRRAELTDRAAQPATEASASSDEPQLLELALDFEAGNDAQDGCALRAMDGHLLEHPEDTALDNWFYLMGVAHAYRRELPQPELGSCDFYLPAAHLYIECFHAADAGAALKAQRARLEFYKARKLPFYEVSAADLVELDAVLPKLLLKHGITVF